MKQEDLINKITRPLRDGIHPCLSLYPMFADLREQLGLLFCELEAEKCDGLAIKPKEIAREINLDFAASM